MADIDQKVTKYLFSLRGVRDFGMKLYAVEFTLGIFDGPDCCFGRRSDGESVRRPAYIIAVAHPDLQGRIQTREQLALSLHCYLGLTIFSSV